MHFLESKCMNSLKISLKFVPTVRINNIPAVVQIMAWRRPGDKPLSEPMTVSLLTHKCVTRPQLLTHWTCVHPSLTRFIITTKQCYSWTSRVIEMFLVSLEPFTGDLTADENVLLSPYLGSIMVSHLFATRLTATKFQPGYLKTAVTVSTIFGTQIEATFAHDSSEIGDYSI